MGNWGIGIWQDDVADDVVIMFDELIDAGAIPLEVVNRVLMDPPWGWGDSDDEPVQVLALAALALQHGALRQPLRNWALATITSGASLGRWHWEGADPNRFSARLEVLKSFQEMLQRGVETSDELDSVTRPTAFALW